MKFTYPGQRPEITFLPQNSLLLKPEVIWTGEDISGALRSSFRVFLQDKRVQWAPQPRSLVPFPPVTVERGRGPWERGCGPFAASHSRGTKPPCLRATVARPRRTGKRQTKCLRTKGIILNSNFLCLSYPSATFALQHGGFVPREWLAAKGLLSQDFIGTLTWKTPSQPSFCRHATHFRPPDFCLWGGALHDDTKNGCEFD